MAKIANVGKDPKRFYQNRAERYRYLVRHYGCYLCAPILDVGGDRGYLRPYIAGRYVNLDRTPEADCQHDLEKGTLPFPDRAFETVICSGTLEHIERFHEVFSELCRVSNRWIIVTLPNCWGMAFWMLRGRGMMKQYGLPLLPPADRHRWFFNTGEAKAFLEAKHGEFKLVRCDMYCASMHPLKTLLAFFYRLVDHERYLNLFISDVWAVLERQGI